MLFFPNTKVNIGLNIVSKRSDGYHDIESLFCPAGLTDVLEFIPLPELPPHNAVLSITGIPVEGNTEDNLCLKAYYLLAKKYKLPAISVHLHKTVPPGAGLGGGSSDAAFMLKNLNLKFQLGLGEEELCALASQLGSDCAFFIKNRPLLCYGRGNVFEEVDYFPEGLEIAIINPGIHIGTAEAYASITPEKPQKSIKECVKLPLENWKEFIKNDFEKGAILKHPIIGNIKERLYEMGAVFASMTGSGSSVYGLFRSIPVELKTEFKDLFYWSGPLLS